MSIFGVGFSTRSDGHAYFPVARQPVGSDRLVQSSGTPEFPTAVLIFRKRRRAHRKAFLREEYSRPAKLPRSTHLRRESKCSIKFRRRSSCCLSPCWLSTAL